MSGLSEAGFYNCVPALGRLVRLRINAYVGYIDCEVTSYFKLYSALPHV